MNVDAAVACARAATDGVVRLDDLVKAAGIKVRREPPWRVAATAVEQVAA